MCSELWNSEEGILEISLSTLTIEESSDDKTINLCALNLDRFVTLQIPDFCFSRSTFPWETVMMKITKPQSPSPEVHLTLGMLTELVLISQVYQWKHQVTNMVFLDFQEQVRKKSAKRISLSICINFTAGWGNLCQVRSQPINLFIWNKGLVPCLNQVYYLTALSTTPWEGNAQQNLLSSAQSFSG